MSWPLQDDFKPGEPVIQVPVDWFNTVSKILNTLVTVGCTLERTAQPGAETPWRLIVAAATGVALSNVTPLKDAATAVVGDDTAAAHGNHVHPLNVGDTVPADIAATADKGNSTEYSRANHVHKGSPAIPANPGDQADLGVASEGSSDNPDTTTWTAGTAGVDLWVLTRPRLDNTVSNSPFLMFIRQLRICADGRIYWISGETAITVSTTAV